MKCEKKPPRCSHTSLRKFGRFLELQKFFSLNVQAVCDGNRYFMYVECRWPGSVHDAKVFANLSIGKNLNGAKHPITYISLLLG